MDFSSVKKQILNAKLENNEIIPKYLSEYIFKLCFKDEDMKYVLSKSVLESLDYIMSKYKESHKKNIYMIKENDLLNNDYVNACEKIDKLEKNIEFLRKENEELNVSLEKISKIIYNSL